MNNFQFSIFNFQKKQGGYTLIELMVAIGLFAIIMLLASGAYFIMINLTRQVQGIATGVDNLSFALETMTRSIRTGTAYHCPGVGGSGNGDPDCLSGASTFSFTDVNGAAVSYTLSGSAIQRTVGGVTSILTDPSVSISSLTFYSPGSYSNYSVRTRSDYQQPHITIIISGTVSTGAGKTQSFSVETGATMRGPDL